MRIARDLYDANHSGMRLKMVRIALSNSHIRVEPGALNYMKGKLEKRSSTGGVLKGFARKMVSGEGLLQTFSGSGHVWLAPTQGIYEKLASDCKR